MPETAFDKTMEHCKTLIEQKKALYDGLHELELILLRKGNVSKDELMAVIKKARDKSLLTH